MIRNPETLNAGFDMLVNAYQEKIYWLARRMVITHEDADDVVQNVFIRVWENLHKFRKESRLFTWIYRIGVNESLMYLKKMRPGGMIPMGQVIDYLSEHLKDDNFFQGNEVERKLQLAILTLPAKQRLVFNMRYFEGHTYEEMSAITGTTVGALKASYHHAVNKIEKSLRID